MKKLVGLLFTLLFVTIISALLTITYKTLKPSNQATMAAAPSSVKIKTNDVDFKNLESSLLNEDGTYYLWFCDNEDNNCTYVENEFITPMLNTLDIDEFETMHKVNFTDCPFSKQKLLDKYNVNNTLAFVKVEVDDNDINYTDSISWDENDPFTYDDLQTWLYDHNIWQQAYGTNINN